MRKYLGVVSIIIFISTVLILYSLIGKVSGQAGTNILLIGVGVSVMTAFFSKKGPLKWAIFGGYGLLILGSIFYVVGVFY